VSVAQTRRVARGAASAGAILLEVRFRRSSNAQRIAGMSQCVGCGVILRRIEGEGCRSPEGGPEGSDFAAEEGYEEGGPDAEEGYEEVWDEVQEALSTMNCLAFEECDETALDARSQASRPSSAASSQAPVRS
jgi:hypothetical protein